MTFRVSIQLERLSAARGRERVTALNHAHNSQRISPLVRGWIAHETAFGARLREYATVARLSSPFRRPEPTHTIHSKSAGYGYGLRDMANVSNVSLIIISTRGGCERGCR